jgi:hypothetical protein
MTQSLANVESYNVAAAQAQAAKYGVAETLKSIMEQTHVQKLFYVLISFVIFQKS